MKRSEMIDEIQYYINECEGYVDSEVLLDIIEEHGMLPPFNYDSFYLDGDNAKRTSTLYYKWEDEK